ncbi:hypothetical protein HY251_05945 [bacterium]|nr:hypothetical protein [bacterium]
MSEEAAEKIIAGSKKTRGETSRIIAFGYLGFGCVVLLTALGATIASYLNAEKYGGFFTVKVGGIALGSLNIFMRAYKLKDGVTDEDIAS